MAVVTPEGADRPKQKNSQSGVVVGVIAGVTATAGLIGFSALTQPAPEAVAESTTTTTVEELSRPIDLDNFDVGQIARGRQLDWTKNQTIENVVGAKLVVFDDDVFLISSPTVPHSVTSKNDPGAVYRYSSGAWVPHGALPAGIPAYVVAATERGLIGVESGHRGEPATLWRSPDGAGWVSETLPRIIESPIATTRSQVATATQETTVVTLETDFDLRRLVADHYRATFGTEPDWLRLWPDQRPGPEGPIITLRGPFGLTLWEFPAIDIGLTEADIQLMNEGNRARLFSASNPGEWEEVDLPVAWINDFVTPGDGSILAFGWPASQTRASWLTFDGVNWEQVSSANMPFQAVSFGEGLAGLWDGGNTGLVVSIDGVEWERVLEGVFPFQFGWWIQDLAGGPAAAAAVYQGWDQTFSGERAPTPSLTVDGVILTLNYPMGEIVIRNEEVAVSYPMYDWDTNGDLVQFDPATGRLAFFDPDTGEVMLSLPLADLSDLEPATFREFQEHPFLAIAHSRDGSDWSIDDVAPSLGDDALVEDVAVTEDLMIITVRRTADTFALPSGEDSSLEIWTAPLP